MAFKRTLAQRLLNITKISSQTHTNCRISSSSVHARVSRSPSEPDPGDNGHFRRFLHKPTGFQPELRSPPVSGNLIERLRAMDIARSRIRLEGLRPPAEDAGAVEGLTVEEARKLMKVAEVEVVKSKLREIPNNCISLSDFVGICSENCLDPDQGLRIAKMLDDSNVVIVLGDVVCLRPEQVAKAIQGIFPMPGAKVHDSVRKEFEEMEKLKSAIDSKAHTLARRELWGGLGFLVVQTLGFMRLTFWELTWDVMEPIWCCCASIYFMACYTFFMTTSREPSFQALYQARFSSKQKRLMKLHNFDIHRYNDLGAACSPPTPPNFDSSIDRSFVTSRQHH